ncbi:MAG: hypothetical protein MOGMAGMI_02294 [Candidatus Omnitrophica bacterium]|nr:hypothetical protein [Candidatus Omnitrophota bacterium]
MTEIIGTYDTTGSPALSVEQDIALLRNRLESTRAIARTAIRRIDELEGRVTVMAELLPGTPPAAPAPNRHVMDAAIALADAVDAWKSDTRMAAIVMFDAVTAFRAALAETEREPVQQDCGCDELWRLARDYVREADRGNGSNVAATALQVYVREHS